MYCGQRLSGCTTVQKTGSFNIAAIQSGAIQGGVQGEGRGQGGQQPNPDDGEGVDVVPRTNLVLFMCKECGSSFYSIQGVVSQAIFIILGPHMHDVLCANILHCILCIILISLICFSRLPKTKT